jgi:hypothetical protein
MPACKGWMRLYVLYRYPIEFLSSRRYFHVPICIVLAPKIQTEWTGKPFKNWLVVLECCSSQMMGRNGMSAGYIYRSPWYISDHLSLYPALMVCNAKSFKTFGYFDRYIGLQRIFLGRCFYLRRNAGQSARAHDDSWCDFAVSKRTSISYAAVPAAPTTSSTSYCLSECRDTMRT